MTDFVAFEIDTYDTGAAGIVTRYISNAGPLVRTSGGTGLYQPRLHASNINITQSLTVNNYGQSQQASFPGGTFEFALDPAIWAWFGSAVHWLGAPVRMYAGASATGNVSDLTLYFTGVVTNLAVDRLTAQVTIESTATLLDDVLVTDLYTTGAIDTLVGLPKPQIWGTVFNVAPVLEVNAPNLIYRVSRLALDSVTEVRLGGIPLIKVTGTPIAGQWKDLADGTIQIGGTTSGGDIRCDARSSDYATMTTAEFITQVAAGKSLSVNSASMSALDTAFPALIGYATTTQPVNARDAIDEVVNGGGCHWGENAAGEIIAGVEAAPGSATTTLDNLATVSSRVTDLVPPAWRIRVEHTRNWAPQSSLYPEATSDAQAQLVAPGLVAPEWSDASIKTAEPRAIDVTLLRSLVQSESDATDIRDRLTAAWGVARRLYSIETKLSTFPANLYDPVQLSASMFSATCRVTSITPGLGGNPATLVLWG